MRKSTHGFPLLSRNKYGAPLGGPLGRRSSATTSSPWWWCSLVYKYFWWAQCCSKESRNHDLLNICTGSLSQWCKKHILRQITKSCFPLSTRVAISFLLHLLWYFLPQSFFLWLFVFEKVFPFFVQRQKKQHHVSWPFNLQCQSFKSSDWNLNVNDKLVRVDCWQNRKNIDILPTELPIAFDYLLNLTSK